jgi:predicted thioredoxin/glutaredoxin
MDLGFFSRMKIDIYLSEMCGSYHELRENLNRALAELGIKPDVTFHTIYYDEAVSRSIMGSPSIWINGKDAFEGGGSPGIT